MRKNDGEGTVDAFVLGGKGRYEEAEVGNPLRKNVTKGTVHLCHLRKPLIYQHLRETEVI